MPDFDGKNSRAILIGASRFEREPKLASLPAVLNNVWDLGKRLTDAKLIGIEQLIRIEDRPYPELIEALRGACKLDEPAPDPFDCLFVYYAGHGLIGSDRSLRLAAANTTLVGCDDNAVPFSSLRRLIDACQAKVKIVALDCCFGGRAVDAGGVAPARHFELDLEGTIRQISGSFTIAACHAAEQAISPHDARHTGFTGVLLATLDKGLDAKRPEVTVRELFDAVTTGCESADLPRPVYVIRENGDRVNFAKNVQFKPDPREAASRLADQLLRHLPHDHPSRSTVVDGLARQVSERDLLKLCDDIIYECVAQGGAVALDAPWVKELLGLPGFREFEQDRSSRWPIWVLKEESWVIRVYANGNGHCQWTRVIAPTKPLGTMWRAVFGDKSAPLKDFGEIKLRVEEGQTGQGLPTAELLNAPTLKEFLFFFTPRLEPTIDVAHTISWMWPGMFNPLTDAGCRQDEWSFDVVSAASTVPKVQTTLLIQEALGSVVIQNTGWGGGGPVNPTPPVEQGFRRYVWQMADVNHGARVVLKITRPPADGSGAVPML